MTNTDAVVNYILSKEKDLSPEKIQALAAVIKALGGEVERSPNDMPIQEDPNLIDEQSPIDLTKVESVVVDGNAQPVKVYK